MQVGEEDADQTDPIRYGMQPFVPGARAADTRARLVAAARELFTTCPVDVTTVHDIVAAAGTSRPSFYTYFATKKDVLIAVGDANLREVDGLMEDLAALPVPWAADDCAVGSTGTSPSSTGTGG
ncbi:TetR/AcrR family transcriptional regulator [Nocardia flavorosea]|uniref:TetR/AcrR family transcriptional regulator n=1 Tax=Nocardia flavorosea TaxID=53429 RepID=UPI002457D621|nr:TetR/AcrR family transcriptional regulator [Nocardia flavorosea]